LSRPLPLSPTPEVTGNVYGSRASETINDRVGKEIKYQERKK
jgi:hypothetical protein